MSVVSLSVPVRTGRACSSRPWTGSTARGSAPWRTWRAIAGSSLRPCGTWHPRISAARPSRPGPGLPPADGFAGRTGQVRKDFDANPSIDPAVINPLATCDWVRKGLPLCLIGDSGTGKSHLLIALGTEAAMAGFRVRYTLATKLVNELVEAADDKQLTKPISRYGRVDLLCVDELGYMELDRRGAELLFQVLTEREEKASVAIASNESFSGWTKTFTDPRLCAAIVDRITFGGNIIETGTRLLPPRPDPRRPAELTPPGGQPCP